MVRRRHKWLAVLAVLGIICLITDAKTALVGAGEGVDLCLRSIIPSLFPLIFLTGILSSSINENSKIFNRLEKVLHLPPRSGAIWVLGSLSGYPVGAQLIANRIEAKRLERADADRLLIFCNNPGPAFIFGVAGLLFTDSYIPFVLWSVQLISSLILGAALPQYHIAARKATSHKSVTIREHLNKAITATANICGWVVLFRTLLKLIDKLLLALLPQAIRYALYGFLELANGCIALQQIPNQGVRFLYCAGLLSFGGLCVGFQTASVLPEAKLATYYQAKLLQSTISIGISLLLQPILFSPEERISLPLWVFLVILSVAIFLYLLIYQKIVVEKKKRMMYNQEKAKTRCA